MFDSLIAFVDDFSVANWEAIGDVADELIAAIDGEPAPTNDGADQRASKG